MKTIKTTLLTAVAATATAIFTASCSDELDALPTQSKVDGNVVVDAKSAKIAVNGIYYQYAMCGEDYYGVLSTGCANSYETYPADFAGLLSYYQGPYMFETHDGGFYFYYDLFWTKFYAQLTAANGAIQNIENADGSWFADGEKEQYLGEARLMRAFVHYNLMRMYAYFWDIDSPYGVLLRTEATTSKNLAKARSSVKDSYDCILEDIDYAIENAPDESENCYTNKWVAKGLKARVLMMRGQSGDYAEALSLTEDIIDNGPYELVGMVETCHEQGLGSADVMFGIQPKENQTDVMEAWIYNSTNTWYPTDNFAALFDGDPRKDDMMSVETVQQLTYDYDAEGNYQGYHYEAVEQNLFFKHMQPGDISATTTEESQYQMRLTEMYLLRAEAQARTGSLAEARETLRQVLTANGYEDTAFVDAETSEDGVLKLIFDEYMRNLSCENGCEMLIMKRFPQSVVEAFNAEYRADNEQYTTFGIPTDEFLYNSAMTADMQNPGYPTESTSSY